MSECGGIVCFQKRHVFCFGPFGALESTAVPFFPFLCIYTFHRLKALFLTILFLEPHAADISVVCCTHGWIPYFWSYSMARSSYAFIHNQALSLIDMTDMSLLSLLFGI